MKIKHFLPALTELYPFDRTQPGLVLSWLADKQVFYGSIVRYDHHMDEKKKQVIVSASNANFEKMLAELFSAWGFKQPNVMALRKLEVKSSGTRRKAVRAGRRGKLTASQRKVERGA